MGQINLRLPEELRRTAEKFAKQHGYKNLQELAKESIRMRITKDVDENLWKELPKETRKGIEEISKLPKAEWKKWYKGIKRKRKEKIEVVDTSLLMDGLIGITTILCVIEFPPAGKYCKTLSPTRQDFKKSLDIAWKLRKIGKPVGTIDILNASMCLNRDLKFITKDKDFENIKLVEPKFKLQVIK